MPNARSFWRVCFVWLVRARALRAWLCWISLAACSNSGLAATSSSHQERMTAATAVWTWHTVSSGFFPPQVRVDFGQEQIADGTQNPMPFQPLVATSFVVVQAD